MSGLGLRDTIGLEEMEHLIGENGKFGLVIDDMEDSAMACFLSV